MNIYCIIFGLVCAALAVAFARNIAPNWIKGWRETPDEVKATIRMDRLSKNVAGIFLILAIILLSAGFRPAFLDKAFVWCMAFWFALTFLDIQFIRKSRRYKK